MATIFVSTALAAWGGSEVCPQGDCSYGSSHSLVLNEVHNTLILIYRGYSEYKSEGKETRDDD